jgi:threonylcarbamoyladenosine tRNA methylthiotransferase MtaB
MKYAFYTLGCKVNQYETQAMQQLLLARGDTLGEFDGVCDCYIVNTCSVTAVSDKKSRQMIRRLRLPWRACAYMRARTALPAFAIRPS